MDKLNFRAQLSAKGETLNAKLELYIFQENGMYIVYCPSLDISAYGKTQTEAKKEFESVFSLHIDYCLNEKTLWDDLANHGWNVKGVRPKKIQSPSIEKMLSTNDVLKDIIFNRNYRKVSKSVPIPEFS